MTRSQPLITALGISFFEDLCEFFKEVLISKHDVKIFLTRRGYVLFRMFEKILSKGDPPVRKSGLCMSDIAIPFCADMLKGKSVLLVDDIFIHGRAFRSTLDVLTNEYKVRCVDGYVFAKNIDTGGLTDEFVTLHKNTKSYYDLPTHSWRCLSKLIVEGIHASGTPYVSFAPVFDLAKNELPSDVKVFTENVVEYMQFRSYKHDGSNWTSPSLFINDKFLGDNNAVRKALGSIFPDECMEVLYPPNPSDFFVETRGKLLYYLLAFITVKKQDTLGEFKVDMEGFSHCFGVDILDMFEKHVVSMTAEKISKVVDDVNDISANPTEVRLSAEETEYAGDVKNRFSNPDLKDEPEEFALPRYFLCAGILDDQKFYENQKTRHECLTTHNIYDALDGLLNKPSRERFLSLLTDQLENGIATLTFVVRNNRLVSVCTAGDQALFCHVDHLMPLIYMKSEMRDICGDKFDEVFNDLLEFAKSLYDECGLYCTDEYLEEYVNAKTTRGVEDLDASTLRQMSDMADSNDVCDQILNKGSQLIDQTLCGG